MVPILPVMDFEYEATAFTNYGGAVDFKLNKVTITFPIILS
jgi:hypothetical protein